MGQRKSFIYKDFTVPGLFPTNQKVVGSNPPGRAKKSLETSTFQGFLLAFSAVPIVQNRAFCAVCCMQNGMQ
jgi:hypothetical protein